MTPRDSRTSTPADGRDASASHVSLGGRRVLVAVCGGIAAYKVCHVVSRLAQDGATVTVAMTPAACELVGPATFQALSGRPVLTDPWRHVELPGLGHDPQHINLARSLDLALVAPCTMDCLARLAHGHADDIVSLLLAAIDRARTPVLLAPSMNQTMWDQPSTQRNLRQVRQDGLEVIEPGVGWQACRTEGTGRLPEPDELLRAVTDRLVQRKPGPG